MNDMSPPLQLSLDPQSDAQRLEGLLRWMLRVLIGCGFAVFSAAIWLQSKPLLWYSLLIFLYVSLLIWARQQLRRQKTSRTILTVSLGMLVCSVASVVLVPDTGPAATLVPLLAVGLALPYLNTRTLRFFIIMTWLVTGLVVVLSETVQIFPLMPSPFATILHLEVIVVTPLISWLLWRSEYRFASANMRSNNSSVSPCTTRSPIYPTGPYLWTGSTRRSCAGNASRPISSQSCFSTSIASKISTTALGIGSAMNCCSASRGGCSTACALSTRYRDLAAMNSRFS